MKINAYFLDKCVVANIMIYKKESLIKAIDWAIDRRRNFYIVSDEYLGWVFGVEVGEFDDIERLRGTFNEP